MKIFEILSIQKGNLFLLTLAVCFFLHNIAHGQTAGTNTVTTAAGQTHTLQEFLGKKVWVVILPSTQTAADSNFLKRIDSVALVNRAFVQTIVVPSYETGYTREKDGQLSSWYNTTLNAGILVSEPLFTNIKSGKDKQNVFFYWLTHASLNGHFILKQAVPVPCF